MRVLVDPQRFTAQCDRFELRFCCEDCAHFIEEARRCAHGWPCDEHRRAHYAQPGCSEAVFCKEFELR